MKILSILLILLSFVAVKADDKIKMYFNNEAITKIIETYSKATGQKFVVDPSVRGQISIFVQEPVSTEEAFNLLSSALAINGFGISKQTDTMVVKSARMIHKDLIEVSTQKPTLKPERMYTWVYTAKNLPVTAINNSLRNTTSKDGDMYILINTNQIVFTDWTSNLNRMFELMKEIDKPVDPAAVKFIAEAKKDMSIAKAEAKKKEIIKETKEAKTEN